MNLARFAILPAWQAWPAPPGPAVPPACVHRLRTGDKEVYRIEQNRFAEHCAPPTCPWEAGGAALYTTGWGCPMEASGAITDLLHRVQRGEHAASQQLGTLIYQELRRIAARCMRGERPGHTLQPTSLVNEAVLRLLGADVPWRDRAHFYAVAARQMRNILVDHARSRGRAKRGGAAVHVPLEEAGEIAAPLDTDLVALDDALAALAKFDSRKHDMVELHYFGGLSIEETAQATGVSPKTVQRELRLAEAWLQQVLRGPSP
jgi:RNA polymerase sigma factor (TIGR02999 family)